MKVDDDAERSERARALLARIAELLRVTPNFFLTRPTPDAAETDSVELMRMFQAIDDADLRRSVVEMVRDLETKRVRGRDS